MIKVATLPADSARSDRAALEGALPAGPAESAGGKALRRLYPLRWLVLVLIFMAIWFACLEQRRLWEPDEGRYAEIPREMLATGDWVTPRLNGLLYFEKPPLQYWATAAVYALLGEHNWSARLWAALTGFAGVLLAFYAGRRLHSPKAGLYGASMLASSVLYFGVAHMNTLDMGLTLFLETTVFALALAWRGEASIPERRFWMHVAWVAAGLAVLSKGLIGLVLPALAVLVYCLLHRDYSMWKKIFPATGAPLLLLVTAPWFFAVARANSDFAQFFFVQEHFQRFTTTVHHRVEPWWFFLAVLALGTLPWATILVTGLWHSVRNRAAVGNFDAWRFLAIWSLVVLVFFSLSDSKLMPYVVPIFPALAVLGGRYVCEASRPALARHFLAAGILVVLILVFLAYKAPAYATGHYARLLDEGRSWLAGATLAWTAGCVGAVIASARRRIDVSIFVLALASIAAYQMVFMGLEHFSPVRSSALLAQRMEPHIREGTRVYAVEMYPQSLPFYLKRTIVPVGVGGELAFGLSREPDKGVASVALFVERWRNEGDAMAVMERKTYVLLQAAGVPMSLIAEDPVRVAVSRREADRSPR